MSPSKYVARSTSRSRREQGGARAGRIVLSLVFIVLVLAHFVPQRGVLAGSGDQFVMTTVRQGDTLWDIAVRMSKDDADIRRVIFDVRKVNNLVSTRVMPGDVLRVPKKWCR
jgi:hypothetical protein